MNEHSDKSFLIHSCSYGNGTPFIIIRHIILVIVGTYLFLWYSININLTITTGNGTITVILVFSAPNVVYDFRIYFWYNSDYGYAIDVLITE